MIDRAFLDTNVLVYAVVDHACTPQALTAVAASRVTSVQVLNEFANVARRKFGRSPKEIRAVTRDLRDAIEIVPLTVALHDEALDLFERYALSMYDSLVVAAALGAGCDCLFSEDLQHGQLFEGRLRVENPFRSVGRD